MELELCPCGCGRTLDPSLGQFPTIMRATGAVDSLLGHFIECLEPMDLSADEVDKARSFRNETARLHESLRDRCHGLGGFREGVRLAKDAKRWRRTWGRTRDGIRSADPDYYDWWDANAIEAWPATLPYPGDET
jgi:hypothetical protein